MTTPLEKAHFSPLGRGMLARARCRCMVLAPRCPGTARTSWAFSPASSPLLRDSLPPPQSSFPTPFPSFLLFPHPSSRPRTPAVLTARVTFHHRILQERDLLDLRMKKVSGKLPCALLHGPPLPRSPPWEAWCPQLLPSPFAQAPSGSRLPGSDPVHPIPPLCPTLLSILLSRCFFPSTVSLSILFCPLSVLRSVTALGPLSLFCPHTVSLSAPLPAVSTAPLRPAAPRWSPEVLAASVGPGLHLHPQGPLMGDATTPSSLANHHPSPPPGPSKPTPLLQLHPPPDFLDQSLESGLQAPRSGNRELGGLLSTHASHLAALPRGIWPCPVARKAARASTRTQAVGPMTTELLLLSAPLSPRPIYSRARPGTAPAALPRARHNVNRPGSAFSAAPHGPAE